MSDAIWNQLGGFAGIAIPLLILLLVVFFAIRRVASWYNRIAPDTMAVISGRKHKLPSGAIRGYRTVIGGGTLVIPILEQRKDMSLAVMPVEAAVIEVPDKDGVLVSVEMNANVKVLSDDQSAPLAIERFLSMDPRAIAVIVKKTLEGNLRSVTGTLTVEELRKDRQKFMQKVVEEAGADLGKMGLGIDNAQIQNISDKRGYLESIGKTMTAGIVRDATIGEANAHRDAAIQSAAARQAGETATLQADQSISDATRDKDVQVAKNAAKVKAEQAQIPIAAEIAAANRTKELNTAQVEAQKATVTAGIELQREQQKLNEAELEATVVTTARKNKDAKIIAAEADQSAATLEGEAFRIKSEKEGMGIQQKQTGEAEGRIRLAAAEQKELEAKAAGNKAGLLAIAAGRLADLESEGKGQVAIAEGLKAKLLAEAAGVEAKALAYNKLDATGRMLMLLAALPPVIEAAGEAVRKSAEPFAKAIGEGLGNIDEVRLINMAAGNATGGNMLSQFANTPVEALFGIIQKLRATQFWPVIEGLAKQAGIDVDALVAAAATPVKSATSSASAVEGVDESAVAAKPASDDSPGANS